MVMYGSLSGDGKRVGKSGGGGGGANHCSCPYLPILIYINDLPNCLNHAIPRMFADDTSISYLANTTDELQNVINSELKKLNSWLITNRLSLNIVKTEFMVIGSQQKLRSIDSEINIRINENEITRVESVKSLGVYIDKHLTSHDHIDKLCKKVASAIGALKRVRSFITIIPYLAY